MRHPFLLLLSFLIFGCETSNHPEGKLRVVATTSILADTVRRVGGDHVTVDGLMGPGIDPHRYSPQPADVDKLHGADLILFHGLHLEGKMDDLLTRNPPRKAVAVCESIPLSRLKSGGDGPHDPHVWMDPQLWIVVVGMVRDALITADPAHREDYEKNTAAYIGEIRKLHEENLKLFAALPAEKRVLVTSHDAFGYFGDAYGLTVRGLQGISTAAETSTKDVEDLTDFLGTRKVPAVFAETSVPPKGLETVLAAVKRKYGHTVRLVGEESALYSDALGEPGTGGETYLGMIRHNVAAIVNGLK
jgi:manganese/zinc/iron transport system substrate-binding protein